MSHSLCPAAHPRDAHTGEPLPGDYPACNWCARGTQRDGWHERPAPPLWVPDLAMLRRARSHMKRPIYPAPADALHNPPGSTAAGRGGGAVLLPKPIRNEGGEPEPGWVVPKGGQYTLW